DPEIGGYTYAISEKEREETEQLRAKIEQQHDKAISRAARLVIEGNTYIREVAEQHPDLQRAIDQAEKHAQRPEEEKDKTPANVDTIAEQQRDLRNEEAERQPNDTDAREAHELASTVDATNRLQDQVNKDKEAAQRGGETTRTDPAQQHIPRLEELEREELEKRERDRDDRER
ncbi:MAG: conjugal transfer protein TraA, partial [Mesorhizobium sp.]